MWIVRFSGLLGASIRSLRVVIIVVGCSSASTSVATPMSKEPSYIRVMTFNIRYDEPQDKENAWPNRKELVASMIRFHHADLVGVQEALARQLKDLETLLPDYSWVGVGRADGKAAGEFSAVLYRKNRFKHLESSTFWLSETPQVPSAGWDAALPRIATWIKLRDLQTGKILFKGRPILPIGLTFSFFLFEECAFQQRFISRHSKFQEWAFATQMHR